MDIFSRAHTKSKLLCAAFALTALTAQPVWSADEPSLADQNRDKASTAAVTAPATEDETLDWQSDFDKALEEGKEQKKFVLVDVYTNWCVYCKKLDREVYANAKIAKYLKENFIVVRANAEDNAQGEAFANKFDAHAYPTILVFDYKSAKTKPKARIFGYLAPPEFDAAMHSVVESKTFHQKHSKSK